MGSHVGNKFPDAWFEIGFAAPHFYRISSWGLPGVPSKSIGGQPAPARRRRRLRSAQASIPAVHEHRHIGLAHDGTKRTHSGQYRVLGARKSLLLARARRRIREATAALHVHDGTVVRQVRTVSSMLTMQLQLRLSSLPAATPSLACLHCSMSIKSSWKTPWISSWL